MEPVKPIRVLFADDHPIVREGLAALIGAQADMEVAGEAANGAEAIELFRRLRPDVTLMDLHLPDMSGAQATAIIRGESPEARIIILTVHAGDGEVRQALDAGASGYILKEALRKDLLESIREVRAGRLRLSPEVARRLEEHAGSPEMTPRERDILAELAHGATDQQIAQNLGISEQTVKSHIKGILGKLGAQNRTQALAMAARRGLVRLE